MASTLPSTFAERNAPGDNALFPYIDPDQTPVESVADLAGLRAIASAPTVETITADGTPAAGTTHLLVDATSGDVTVTLPASTRRDLVVKRVDGSANTVTVDGDAAETIDGATELELTNQYESVTLVGDATGWWIT